MTISAENIRAGAGAFAILSFCNFFLSRGDFSEEETYQEIRNISGASRRTNFEGLKKQVSEFSKSNYALEIFFKTDSK